MEPRRANSEAWTREARSRVPAERSRDHGPSSRRHTRRAEAPRHRRRRPLDRAGPRLPGVPERGGRPRGRGCHPGAVAPEPVVVPGHLGGTPAPPPAPHHLVGGHQRYPRQGHGPPAGPARRAPARVGHRLRADLSELRTERQRHPRRPPAPGRGPRLQHDDRGHVRTVCRKVRAGSHHPRPYAGRRTGGARLRGGATRLQGGHAAGEPGAAHTQRPGRRRPAEDRLVLRQHRPRQPLRLRSPVAAVRGTRRGRDPALGQRPLARPGLHQQLHLQPRGPFRRIQPRVRPRRLPGRPRAALPDPQLRVHGRRRELGLPDVRGPDRALGEAPPGGAPVPGRHPRPGVAPSHPPVRRRKAEGQR